MNRKLLPFCMVVLFCGALVIAACVPSAAATPTPDPIELITQAAGTVAAEMTQNAPINPTPSLTNPPLPMDTPLPPQASVAPPPTQPPAATDTPAPVATQGPAKSADAGSFVADVTIPDGTGAVPGMPFPKTWRIKNTGTTTWTAAYALVWIEGDKMGGPDSIPMPNEVRPGEEVELTMNLVAPSKAGSYQTFYRLRNASGQFFRLDGGGDLWVKIAVGSGASPTPDQTETAAAPTPTPSDTPAH